MQHGIGDAINRVKLHWKITASIIFLLLVGTVYAWQEKVSVQSSSDTHFYYKQLTDIKDNVNNIKVSLLSRETLVNQSNLNDYYAYLHTIVDDCNVLTQRAKNSAEDLKNTIQKSVKLCNDLLPIVHYQNDLYGQLQGIIYIDTLRLPRPEDPSAPENARNISNSIAQIRSNLSKIKNTRFSDPALPEINTLLNQLKEQADASMQGNNAVTPETYNLMLKNLDHLRADFMLRRGYFWNNTVDIQALETVLNKQIEYYKIRAD